MPVVGVVLSGCGVQDGTEIQEAVITLLALDRCGAAALCMAPNIPQRDVVNHLTGKAVPESRNVLVESARIARGWIRDIATVEGSEVDALVFPGGFGAAKNLSSFAVDGHKAQVDPQVKRLVGEMVAARKPIAALCIAPALLAKALEGSGVKGVRLTIGTDPATAKALEAMGASHEVCPVENYILDDEHHIISTPAYMLGPGIKEVAEGIENTIDCLMAILKSHAVR